MSETIENVITTSPILSTGDTAEKSDGESLTIEDLLVALQSEVHVLALAMPLIREHKNFAASSIYNMISRSSDSKNNPPCKAAIHRALQDLFELNILKVDSPKGGVSKKVNKYSFAEGTDSYKLAALVALDYVGDSGNSLYTIFHGSNSDSDLYVRNVASLINMLRRARYSRPASQPLKRRLYLSQPYVWKKLKLPETTIRRKLEVLKNQKYIGTTEGGSELGIFKDDAVAYLQGSKSEIDKSIVKFLDSQGLPSADGNLSGYLIRRNNLQTFLADHGHNLESGRSRVVKLRSKGYYQRVHGLKHNEIYLKIKGNYLVGNLLKPLSQIVKGNTDDLTDEKYGWFRERSHIRKAVTACVNAYAKANGSIKAV